MFVVALDRIKENPWQTRDGFDIEYVRELARDIASRAETRPATKGLLQVPLARIVDAEGKPVSSDVFGDFLGGDVTGAFEDQDLYTQLAFGHSRLRAFELLYRGLDPEIVPSKLGLSLDDTKIWRTFPLEYADFTDEEMATAAWTENAQRKDLSPLEEARALQQALDHFGWTQTRLSEEWGLAASTISNKRRLLQLPGKVLKAVDAGEISERSAAAFLPLYDLPGPTLAVVKKNDWYSPDKLLEKARNDKSSDWIRNKVDYVIGRSTKTLNADFELDMMAHDFADEQLRSPQCAECELLIDYSDKTRCGDIDCHNRKEVLWKQHRLSLASETTGLPILPESADFGDREKFIGDEESGQEIYESGDCDCLHLRWAGYSWDLDHGVHLEEYPDVAICCYHPDRARCECLAARKAARTREENMADDHLQEKRERERETARLVGRANDALATALKEQHEGAWLMVLQALNMRGEGDGWNFDKIISRIAKYTLREMANLRWIQDEPEESRCRIEEKFKEFDLEVNDG